MLDIGPKMVRNLISLSLSFLVTNAFYKHSNQIICTADFGFGCFSLIFFSSSFLSYLLIFFHSRIRLDFLHFMISLFFVHLSLASVSVEYNSLPLELKMNFSPFNIRRHRERIVFVVYLTLGPLFSFSIILFVYFAAFFVCFSRPSFDSRW